MGKRYHAGKVSGAIWAIAEEPEDIEFERMRGVDRLKIQDAPSGLAAAVMFTDTVGIAFSEMWATVSREFVLGFMDGALANYHPAPDQWSRR